jgi:uncharacterized protein
MKKTALITGASNGIGLELALIHAAKGDNLILVARSTEKLAKLKQELETSHSISVTCIGKDLSLPQSASEVYEEVKQLQVSVDYLINNAGFGDFGLFHQLDWTKQHQMIELNITTLTDIAGKQLLSFPVHSIAGNTQVQAAQLKAGIYFVQLYNNHALAAVQKIIIQH